MTSEQAKQTIAIVLDDQRTEVLKEVRSVIDEHRREAMDAKPTDEMAEIGHLATINAMDVLDAKIELLIKRG